MQYLRASLCSTAEVVVFDPEKCETTGAPGAEELDGHLVCNPWLESDLRLFRLSGASLQPSRRNKTLAGRFEVSGIEIQHRFLSSRSHFNEFECHFHDVKLFSIHGL